MIVDTSAILAIIKEEPGAQALADLILRGVSRMSSASYVELMWCFGFAGAVPAAQCLALRGVVGR